MQNVTNVVAMFEEANDAFNVGNISSWNVVSLVTNMCKSNDVRSILIDGCNKACNSFNHHHVGNISSSWNVTKNLRVECFSMRLPKGLPPPEMSSC
jgi:hypothetical protein